MERRATASQWRVMNPILASYDIGVESDTGKSKLGNGQTKWNSLAYRSATTIVPSPGTGTGTGSGGNTSGGVSSNPASITQDSTHRFVSDEEKALWSGKEICIAGEDLAIGDLCYLSGDGKYYKCNATTELTSSGKLGLSNSLVTTGNNGEFIINGKVARSGLVSGTYFASSIPGEITNIAPSGSGMIVRIIGYAESSSILYFNPSSTFLELL